ncbi:hypothetical protein GCM10011571_20420 [Marinithermofilum abyssi]|uniref:Uncharacterized protein n=1 Tax=Marinithermofilum abyssi TaxID=1571185 RepID=A0A8J2YE68_9BACL|nr:hypothetical protein GCM10011571_20420 [Marinithermofilum abyssi]
MKFRRGPATVFGSDLQNATVFQNGKVQGAMTISTETCLFAQIDPYFHASVGDAFFILWRRWIES